MKKQLIATAFAIISIARTQAQNTFPVIGNVGIGTLSPATSLQVIGTSRLGGATNYSQFDVNGNLSFIGASTYKVGGNRYAFQYSGGNYGLFFNTTGSQYEFRNSTSLPVFSVNWLTGNGILNGSLKVGAYTLPATDGTNGQVLKTNGAGVLTWSADNTGSSATWLLSGNSGTNPATQFIGTKDAKSLVFKVNNIRSGFIEADELKSTTAWGQYALLSNTGAGNTALGYKSLFSNSTGYDNTSTGSSSLYSNTTGNDNTATGYQSLNSNTTGSSNTANGSVALSFNTTGIANTATGFASLFNNTTGYYNTATGSQSLTSNTTGLANTANGNDALYSNSTGSYNTAIGYTSLKNNTMGYENSAIGSFALVSNTTGHDNTAAGVNSLANNTIGSNNSAFGVGSLGSNYAGDQNTALGAYTLSNSNAGSANTAVGFQVLQANTTGAENSALGVNALYSNTIGIENTAMGIASLSLNTTGSNNSAFGSTSLGSNVSGNYNTALGSGALYGNTTGSDNTATGSSSLVFNTTGNFNTATGFGTLQSNTTGEANTATGFLSLNNNYTGGGNTAYGSYSLLNNSTGYYNTANGDSSLFYNTSGYSNTGSGYKSLLKNTTGIGNTAVGLSSLLSNTTGFWNVALGYGADNIYNGSYNTAIGAFANITANNITNSVVIGYNATVGTSNTIHIGNNAINSISGQVNWTTYSDERVKNDIKENVPGLKFIKALRPVTYHYNREKENELMGIKSDTAKWEGKDDLEKINFSGMLAQEVDAAAKKINYDFSGVDKTGKVMGLRYADFVPSLVKAVQELSEQVDRLNEKIKSFEQGNGNSSTSANANEQVNTITLSNARLEQNTPNPFGETTYIKYYVPSTAKQVQLIITDMNGKTVKKETIHANGNGQVNIDAAALSAGTYTYTLYVDGKRIDLKQMVHISTK